MLPAVLKFVFAGIFATVYKLAQFSCSLLKKDHEK